MKSMVLKCCVLKEKNDSFIGKFFGFLGSFDGFVGFFFAFLGVPMFFSLVF